MGRELDGEPGIWLGRGAAGHLSHSVLDSVLSSVK